LLTSQFIEKKAELVSADGAGGDQQIAKVGLKRPQVDRHIWCSAPKRRKQVRKLGLGVWAVDPILVGLVNRARH
jgi:hypothetical protein